MTAMPARMADWMMIGARTTLRMCRATIRVSESPATVAASTYSSFLTPMVWVRTSRNRCGERMTPKADIVMSTDGPNAAMTASRRTLPGTDSRTSATQLATASKRRPEYPATRPAGTPMTAATTMARAAPVSVSRVP